MGIRPLLESDVPQTSELHRRVMGAAAAKDAQLEAAYRRWFEQVFLADGGASGVRSLVHVDDRGRIDGFLGVAARRMRMGGRSVLAAVSSQFIVDPSARSRLVAFELLKRFLTGPQDLSVADEANARTEKLWRAFGGVSAPLYGTYWLRPLRPFALLASFGAGRARMPTLARVLSPTTLAFDEVLRRAAPGRLLAEAPGLSAEPLTVEAFVEHAPRFADRGALRPDHDVASLRWALSRATGPTRGAPLECALLRDDDGEAAGLYVAAMPAGGAAEVLHASARQDTRQGLVRHILRRAHARGALSVGGRVEPPLMRALSDCWAFFHQRGPHVLLHARRPELYTAFDRGAATFSRLEGEYCLRFVEAAA